jgi:hypothetical protein
LIRQCALVSGLLSNTARFFLMWITITAAAAICVAAVGSGASMWRCQAVLQATVGNVV